jgi:transcriptional regulator with XRE-family HTH domain
MAKRRIQHAKIVGLFAARLRELRHSRGLTQATLARQAHVTTSYVGRSESGGQPPALTLWTD